MLISSKLELIYGIDVLKLFRARMADAAAVILGDAAAVPGRCGGTNETGGGVGGGSGP